MFKRTLSGAVTVLLTLLVVTPLPCRADTPSEVISRLRDSAIAILTDTGLDSAQRRDRIRSIITDNVNFAQMSRRILAVNWKKADPDQRERFAELFIDLLEATYVDYIDEYSNETVKVVRERVKDTRAIVDTIFITGDNEIPVVYKLILRDGQWRVIDISIEDVSLVSNFRETYGEIVAKDGIDGLLGQMADQIKEMRAEKDAEN
jgi:phospholipid transport system substrate-binding protein